MVLSASQRSFLLFLFFLEVVVLSLFFCPSPSRGGGGISLIALPRLWVNTGDARRVRSSPCHQLGSAQRSFMSGKVRASKTEGRR